MIRGGQHRNSPLHALAQLAPGAFFLSATTDCSSGTQACGASPKACVDQRVGARVAGERMGKGLAEEPLARGVALGDASGDMSLAIADLMPSEGPSSSAWSSTTGALGGRNDECMALNGGCASDSALSRSRS